MGRNRLVMRFKKEWFGLDDPLVLIVLLALPIIVVLFLVYVAITN